MTTLQLTDLKLSMPPPPRISPQQSSKQPARSPAGPSSQGQATLASLQNLALSGAQIDLLARRVTIDRVALRRPAASLARDARGMLNAAAWLVTPTPAPTPAPTPVPAAAAVTTAAKAPPARPGHGPAAAQSDPAWQLQLRELAWQGGQLQWADALPATPVHLRLGQFRGRLQDLAWPPVPAHAPGPPPPVTKPPPQPPRPAPRRACNWPHGWLPADKPSAGTTPAHLRAGAETAPAEAGQLDWQGRIGLAPLQADGRLTLQRLPLHLLLPYAQAELPVHLQHADIGFQGRLQARQQAERWQAGLRGICRSISCWCGRALPRSRRSPRQPPPRPVTAPAPTC